MANINHKWKRILAVSCSHAKYCDKEALDAVIKFQSDFKPHTTIHLGDFVDLTALMAGAKGSSEAEPLIPDIDTGLMHLKMLKANIVLCGNHEDRAWRLQSSNNAVVAHAAYKIVEAIGECCKKLRAPLIPYDGVFQMFDIADIGFQHGVLFNEMAARDTAEAFCNSTRRKVVFGHSHKVSMQPGRNLIGGMGYNIGTLTKRSSMDYAKARRATLAWTQAFLWGEYCEELKQSCIHITSRESNQPWRLP
jgi:predicted phosphodiesterase